MSLHNDEPNVFVDDDGLLRAGGRWVALTDAQVPVVRLLVSRLGSLVRNDELLAAYGAGGGTATNGSLRPLVYRLRQRLAPLGLDLHVVRSRGVLLEPSQRQETP